MAESRGRGVEVGSLVEPGRFSRRASLRLGVLVLLSGAGVTACTPPPDLAPAAPCDELRWDGPSRRLNLVVIVNDTMRRDRVGSYGGSAHTPHFDAFAADGLLFESAYTQSPWTKPSIATLFTSFYPSQHGVLSDPQARDGSVRSGEGRVETIDALAPGFVTLAEVLRDAGYRTGAIVSNPWLDERFGFAQGFDSYDASFARFDLPGQAVTDAALRTLEEVGAEEPFFLYLHYLDSHRPYPALSLSEIAARAEEIDRDQRELSRQVRRLVAGLVLVEGGGTAASMGVPPTLTLLDLAYDKGVAEFDDALGRFLAVLDQHPARDHTAVIVTSDHGEALFTRGYGAHGRGLFDDEVAIPLAARLPGVESDSTRIGCLTGLIDLMPTLCDYLDLECPDAMFGTSLLAPPDGADPRGPRYLVTEGVGKRPGHRAIRNQSYKMMWEPVLGPDEQKKSNPYSLYDIAHDPEEQRDLLIAGSLTSRNRGVFEHFSELLPRAVPESNAPDQLRVPLDAETAERLRALGYLDE